MLVRRSPVPTSLPDAALLHYLVHLKLSFKPSLVAARMGRCATIATAIVSGTSMILAARPIIMNARLLTLSKRVTLRMVQIRLTPLGGYTAASATARPQGTTEVAGPTTRVPVSESVDTRMCLLE